MELLGTKVGMTQVFAPAGNMVGVTVIAVGPCTVLQRKTVETDGYAAYQLGLGEVKAKNAPKPLTVHCQKAGVGPARYIREFRNDNGKVDLKVGDKVTVKEFETGQYVDVIATSKGKGFQGVVRRHKFRGGDATHGAKGWHRRSGAIGQRMTPGRVLRNMKMPGHMGNTNITTQNLRVMQVRETENLLLLEGAVPGPRGGLVVVRHAKKRTKVATKA